MSQIPLPPAALEQNGPRTGAVRNRGAGGNLLGNQDSGGLRIAPVQAANLQYDNSQSAMLQTLAQAIGFSGNIYKQIANTAADEINADTQRVRSDIAQLTQTRINDQLANQQVHNTGLELANKALPDLQAQAVRGDIKPEGDETYPQFISRVRSGIVPEGSDPVLVKAAERTLAAGLDQIYVGKAREAADLAKGEITQSNRDAVLQAGTPEEMQRIVTLHMATTRTDQTQAESQVLVPAMMAAAQMGNTGRLQAIRGVLGNRFIADQSIAQATYDRTIAEQNQKATVDYGNTVAAARLAYSDGRIGSDEVIKTIRAYDGIIPANAIQSEFDQFQALQTGIANEQMRQAQLINQGIAKQNVANGVASVLNSGGVVPKTTPLIGFDGQPMRDADGTVKMESTDAYVQQVVEQKAAEVLGDPSKPPEVKVVEFDKWLGTAGQTYPQWTGQLKLGASVDAYKMEIEKASPEDKAIATAQFFQGYKLWKAMSPIGRQQHEAKADAVYENVDNMMKYMAPAPGETPETRAVRALRTVQENKARGIDSVSMKNEIDAAIPSLLNVNTNFLGLGTKDPVNEGVVREQLALRAKALDPGRNGSADAVSAAALQLQQSYRQLGGEYLDVMDPHIINPGDTASDVQAFMQGVARDRAKEYIAANKLKDNPDGYYMRPNLKGGWVMVTTNNDVGIPTEVPGSEISYPEFRKMLNGGSVEMYNATGGYKHARKDKTKFSDIPSAPTGTRSRTGRLDY